jgi:hypothetical protein
VRREAVVLAVPRQEGHAAASDLADEHSLTRLAERRVDLDLFGVGQELVKARPADDPDVRDRGHWGQATFSLEEDEDVELLAVADEVESLPDFAGDPESDEVDDAEESPDFDEDEDDVEFDEPLLRLSVR